MTENPKNYFEDDLAEQIQSDLECYFQSRGFVGYSTKPSGTRQGFEDLAQFCGDLIAASENFGALILEVKVRKPGKTLGSLRRYKEDQHTGLKILESANVPIYFAYDESSDFSSENIEQNLKQIRSPLPSELDIALGKQGKVLTTGKLNSVQGLNLFEVLENRKSAGAVNACAALKFAFDSSQALIYSGINQLTTRVLLIVYSKAMNQSIVLNEKNAKAVFTELKLQRAAIASNKGDPEFFEIVNNIETEISELLSRSNNQDADVKNKASNGSRPRKII